MLYDAVQCLVPKIQQEQDHPNKNPPINPQSPLKIAIFPQPWKLGLPQSGRSTPAASPMDDEGSGARGTGDAALEPWPESRENRHDMFNVGFWVKEISTK